MIFKDLVEGYRIGKLTLVDKTDQRASYGSNIWKCKCDCLRQPVCLISEKAIITGPVSSCGCVDNEEKANSILNTMYEKDDDKIRPESIGLYQNDDNSQLNSSHLDDIDEDIVNHVLLFLERKGNPILLDRHERNINARAACIEYYKKKYRWVSIRCFICDFSFGDIYGDDLEEKIHVHHKEQISSKSELEYEINPHNDLVPVCPNCHMVLHSKRNGCYTPDEVKVRDEEYCGNTIICSIYAPYYSFDKNYGKHIKDMSVIVGKLTAHYGGTLQPTYTMNPQMLFTYRDFHFYQKCPLKNNTFSDFILFSVLCVINYVRLFINEYFTNEFSSKLRFAYVIYYYLVSFLAEANNRLSTNFQIDNKYADNNFRNCMAHYGLGQVMKEEDILKVTP